MFHVYILYSTRSQRLYVGVTADVKRRLGEHNAGKVTSTKAYRPYKLVTYEKHQSKKAALGRERQIKKSGILRKYFKTMALSSSLV